MIPCSTTRIFPALVHSLKDCIDDARSVDEWQYVKELIAIDTKSKISQATLSLTPVSMSGSNIPFSQYVRNLGVFIDETLSMDVYVKHLCRILFCQLRRLGNIRSFLSSDAANKLAVSLILTRLDYRNSLLAGLPENKLNKLQCIQNHAARVVLHKPRDASATSLLRTLHWLSSLKRGSITKLLACAFSVSLTTPCHLTFLAFFINTIHLERCTVLTLLRFQFIASVWRPLTEDPSLSLAPLSGIPYLYLSEKLSVFQLSKRS